MSNIFAEKQMKYIAVVAGPDVRLPGQRFHAEDLDWERACHSDRLVFTA